MSLELALKGLISEVLKEAGIAPAAAASSAAPTPARRGRPPKGPEGTPAVPAADPQSTPPQNADPFAAASPAAAPAPVGTVEDARNALTALSKATSQANAVAVMKGVTGSETLTPGLTAEQYGKLVEAAKKATPVTEQPPADPFAATAPAPAAAPAAKPLTIEDVRNVIVETQKRTSADTCKKVVMDHGGKAPKPDGGGDEAALSKLPPENFQKVIDALKALPSTK